MEQNNVSKIILGNPKYFYLKDHLSSVRCVIDESNNVVSAQDYDAWGYLMENRSYESSLTKYKFTGKERDSESMYDYFGARYYDSRIGRWGGVDIKFHLQFSYSPYSYCINNPLTYLDYRGEKIYWGVSGEYSADVLNELRRITGLTGLDINKESYLYLSSNDILGGSETAREKILEILESSEVIELYSDDRFRTMGEIGGTIVNLNPGQVISWINGVQGGLDVMAVGWGITFMHEIYHTKFGYSTEHEEETFGDIGVVEQKANEIRRELGLPERLSYLPLKINYGDKTIRLIPFDKESKSMMNDLIQKGNKTTIQDLESIIGKFIKY